jgi:hypothetical protein
VVGASAVAELGSWSERLRGAIAWFLEAWFEDQDSCFSWRWTIYSRRRHAVLQQLARFKGALVMPAAAWFAGARIVARSRLTIP